MAAAAEPVDNVPAPSKYDAPLWMAVVSGTVGGTCAILVGYPFESVKVRMQTGATTQLFRSLYAGVSAPLVSVTPLWALMYGSYAFAQSCLSQKNLTALERGALSGAFCGGVCALGSVPSEVVKIHAQNSRLTAWKAFTQLYSAHGLRGLFHGLVPTTIHLVFSQMVFFAAYEVALEQLDLEEHGWAPSDETVLPASNIDWRPAVAGGMAGIAEWSISMPTDTVKTRFQVSPVGTRLRDVWRETYRSLGVRGFYRGYLAVLLRAVPVNASTFFVVELVNNRLRQSSSRKEKR